MLTLTLQENDKLEVGIVSEDIVPPVITRRQPRQISGDLYTRRSNDYHKREEATRSDNQKWLMLEIDYNENENIKILVELNGYESRTVYEPSSQSLVVVPTVKLKKIEEIQIPHWRIGEILLSKQRNVKKQSTFTRTSSSVQIITISMIRSKIFLGSEQQLR